MKALIFFILILFTFSSYSQKNSKSTFIGSSKGHVKTLSEVERPVNCCKHLDEEFGETWTLMYFAKDILDAQRLIDRYKMFDIANDFFESNGEYYIELVDPSDTLEYLKKYNLKLFSKRHKEQLIYIDFLVTDNNEVLYDSDGNKIMFR